jgi:hypothetical protein
MKILTSPPNRGKSKEPEAIIEMTEQGGVEIVEARDER